MKLAVLYSGGKDSNLALYKASKYFEIACLINIKPKSSESMIFHFPLSDLVKLQAEALNLPLIQIETGDEEREQIESLRKALKIAKEKYKIEGVVTGAIRSFYQASRFQKICYEMDLWCFNPLWLKKEEEIVKEILDLGFEVIITRLATYPFRKEFLGSKLDEKFLNYLKEIKANLAGEGGEYETFVLWMPLFKKRIWIEFEKVVKENEGEIIVKKAVLEY